ncbi:MAG: PTS transporter subunit IIC [Anaerolineales bacterium]|jgi:PTS system galactitol-specific IIC component
MDNFLNAFQSLTNLGAPLLLPVVIFIIGLILRQKPGQALLSALKIGIGFTLINVALGALLGAVIPATQAMVERSGLELSVIDVGWGTLASIGWGSRYGLLIIPLFLVINLIMLAFNWTKTFNVDIWNFWHVAYTAAIVQVVSGSFVLGLIAGIIAAVVVLLMADFTQKKLSDFIGVPGISITTLEMSGHALVSMGLNKLLDKIFPRLKDVDWSFEGLRERLGVIGDPIISGVIVGALLGIFAGFSTVDVLSLSVTVAAVLYLFPLVIRILMEALQPLAEAGKAFFQKRYADRDLYIGMDWILLLKPEHFTLGVLLIPIAVGLAFILPGNKVLPLGDLALALGFVLLAVPYTNRNLLKSLIIGVIELTAGLYIAGWMAPAITEAATAAAISVPEGASQITGLLKGGDYIVSLLTALGQLLGGLFGG